VWAAVHKLDYRPNLVARSLRAQKTSTIGLIVSDIRNPFFTAISRAVEDTAHEQGYSVFLCNTDEDPAKEAHYLNLMQDEHVAGLIFSPTRHTAERFATLPLHIPAVIIDREISDPHAQNIDMVLIDNLAAGRSMGQHLVSQGYQRIAAIIGAASTTGWQRRQGLAEALHSAGLELSPEMVRLVPPQIEMGRQAALSLLDQSPRPDAIFTSNSLLTAGAMMALHEREVAIPAEVALAGFDETTWATLVRPAITLIAQPTTEIGRTATELLLKRLADPQRAVRQVILQTQLFIRDSTIRKG
jgi:LacI family transcriptional regulator, fructose operon transcriptional repressor